MNNRPNFPRRAVVTAGMPYGNKELHIGHIGGVFVPADVFARFLRDRLGGENVLFVSGTDCCGSPIVESHNQARAAGYQGSLEEFVTENHQKQAAALTQYAVAPDLFAASAFGRAGEIHRAFSADLLQKLYNGGHLQKRTTLQFYDPKREVVLNGRQVMGRCPIAGCKSEHAYADECALGHSYDPRELIAPKSTLTGETPEMREVAEWYLNLPDFREELEDWKTILGNRPESRDFMLKSIGEFLVPPAIYLKRECLPALEPLTLPDYKLEDDPSKPSVTLIFKTLPAREEACETLAAHQIRYRTGKTLTPFRLTGSVAWGIPAPDLTPDMTDRTFWVWPESLWAPISFTIAALEKRSGSQKEPSCDKKPELPAECTSCDKKPELPAECTSCDEKTHLSWKDFWCSDDARVYQFIGQDNITFYGPAQSAIWMAYNRAEPVSHPAGDDLRYTSLIANNHLLYLGTKASSSSAKRPPTAAELLDHYSADALRMHFLGLGLGLRSVAFKPAAFDPNANPNAPDPVLKENALLTGVMNRAARSCFYTAQKYTDSRVPSVAVGADALKLASDAALEVERLMSVCAFHQVMSLLDTFIRDINKRWAHRMKAADAADDNDGRLQTLVDGLHLVRVACVLLHPIVPERTEHLAKMMNMNANGDYFSWERIFDSVHDFCDADHKLAFLPPKTDFFV